MPSDSVLVIPEEEHILTLPVLQTHSRLDPALTSSRRLSCLIPLPTLGALTRLCDSFRCTDGGYRMELASPVDFYPLPTRSI